MGLLGTMTVRFQGDTSGLSSAVKGIGGLLGALPGPVGIAVGAIAGIGAATIGVGVASMKMAGDYQQAMNMVQALTGASSAQMAEYNSGLQKLAINAGVAPKELAKGLYYVISAGYQGKQAMDVLTLSTEDAKIGMTDQATTANALTTVLKSFSVQGKDVTRVNGEMLQTVTLGKMTMADYAGAIGRASSTSVQFHVSMETMNASIATLTANGIPSARQAVTDYNQAVSVMYGNIGTVTKSLEKSGIAFDEQKFNAASYTDKIQMMANAIQEAADKHVKITGVTKQAAQAILTISQHTKEFNKDLQTLSDKQAMAKKTQEAWAITQSGFNQQMSRLHAALDVFMIKLGTALLPLFTKFVSWLTANAIPVLLQLADWFTNTGAPALQNFANFIQQNVVPAIVLMVTWFRDQAWPVLQKFGAILVTQIIPIVQRVAEFIGVQLNYIKTHWTQIWSVLGPILSGVWHDIQGIIQIAWSLVSGIIKIGLDLLQGHWGQAWNDFKDMLAGVWEGIKNIVKGGADFVIGILNGLISGFNSMSIDIGPIHIHPNIPTIPALDTGGYVSQTGLAVIHQGEQVVPASVVRSGAGGSSGDSHIHIYLDSTQIAEVVASKMQKKVVAKYGPAYGRAA